MQGFKEILKSVFFFWILLEFTLAYVDSNMIIDSKR